MTMKKQNPGARPMTLFISHRHEDCRIADIFRKAFEEWSNGEVTIFQSSNAKTAPSVGDELDDVVRKAAADASVLLLIYTVTDDDWTWCMYECGLAQDPATFDTRILVFHTPADPPAPLQHLITLPMSIEALETLAEQFHRSTEFFPGRDQAIAPTIKEDQIKQRSMALYQNLTKEIRDVQIKSSIRYDQITLSIPFTDVERIKSIHETEGFDETFKHASKILAQKCVIESFTGEPHTHFIYEAIPKNLEFAALVKRWRKESRYSQLTWDEELYAEITRAILDIKEGMISVPFNSVDPDSNAWFLPLLHSVRIIPHEAKIEMDISLCKLKGATAKAMIGEIS
jgi:hypothetical protein